ncbi:DNA ligase ATP-dependent [Trinorchestia longiramus]|nr:DNA ligase ATP-dependent [Trinorchestia longiramus]
MSVSNSVPWSDLCRLLDKIKSERRDRKKELLQNFMQSYRNMLQKRRQLLPTADDSFFPVLRVLLPALDKDRGAYGVKEKKLADLYIKILGISKTSTDAIKLLNYRKPKTAGGSSAGDFAEVAFYVLKNRCPAIGQLSLMDVDKHLTDIATHHAAGQNDVVTRIMLDLLRAMTALEQKWLIRVLLKDMQLGLGTSAILNAWHPDARDYYDVNNSLSKVRADARDYYDVNNSLSKVRADARDYYDVNNSLSKVRADARDYYDVNNSLSKVRADARDYYDVNNSLSKVSSTLRDPEVRLHEIEVSLFSPFRPMLAERAVLEKVEAQMHNKTYVAEEKFDGERSQIHKQGEKYMYFSRNGFDFTSSFGGSPREGSLTPHLHPLLRSHVDDAILDGEVVCWHKVHNVVITKGEHYDVKNLKEDGDIQVCFCAFDLLLLNGKVLTNLPLSDRRQMLLGVLQQQQGRLMVSPQLLVTSRAEVVAALNAAIDRREEGLVLKDPDSTYRPAARSAGWIKLKPDYVDSLVPELDLVIVGGYYGAGRQHGVLSHFLLAAAHSDTVTDGGRVTRVVSVCRVGSGYTDDTLATISARLTTAKSPSRPSEVLECRADKPDVWFFPSRSVVLQIRAAEVSTTKAYCADYTLRFPRVETVRADKSWQDILTTAQLAQLYEEGKGKLVVDHYKDPGDTLPKAKAARWTVRDAALPSHFKPADLTGLEQICSLLSGKELCVLEGDEEHSKQDLERLVAQCGGSVTQNPTPKTLCVLSDRNTVRCANLAKRHNIIKPSWMLRSKEKGRLLPWGPLDAVSLLSAEKNKTRITHDQFGDSYTEDLDEKQLIMLLNSMQEVVAASQEDLLHMEDLMSGVNHAMFHDVSACMIDASGCSELAPSLASVTLRLHGAAVVNRPEEATHLVCSGSERPNPCPGGILVVSDAWVDDCIKAHKRLDEGRYLIV